MRELRIRRTAAEALADAQTAAIASIGLRGRAADKASARAIREARRARDTQRWDAIARAATRTRFKPFVNEDSQSSEAQAKEVSEHATNEAQ